MEIPICKKHERKMVYSQYSYYWFCPKCIEEDELNKEERGDGSSTKI